MAGKKENLKSLFSNTRTRVIIIFTVFLIIVAVVIGYIKLRDINSGPSATATLSHAPGSIQSIPGVLNPTAQYAKLQEEQNVNQADKAEKSGGSSIPTIIRTQALGEGVGVIGSQVGQSGSVGFVTLTREGDEGAQKSLWLQTLQDKGCSKSVVSQIVSQGAQLSDLKGACSCAQLKDNGYSLTNLSQVCPCKELKAAGYNARQLKDAGYSAARLRDCGFNACELRNAGFTAQELKDAGFSDDELKGAGYLPEDIAKASGLPNGMTAADVLKAGCSVDALTKLRKSGVTASAIRRISGCSAAQLKAAGFSAQELRNAGFSAADLKKAGYLPEELKAAGYSARDLLNAGYTPEELAKLGYSSADIKASETELPPGITADEIRKAGCDPDALKKAKAAGVSALNIKKILGCSAQALKDAGYTAKELKEAGFTAGELKNAGFTAKELNSAGFSAKELTDAGFSAKDLKDAGFSAKELKDAGFSASGLKGAGFSAKDLKDAGFSAKELKDAGFSASDLKGAGFSAKDLKDAGFSAKELKDAGFSASDLKGAGFSAKDLKDAGFNANDLKNAGFSPSEIQNAGYKSDVSQVAGIANPNMQQGAFKLNGVSTLGQNSGASPGNSGSNEQLQAILNNQNQQAAEQKYQQKITQKSSDMLGAANALLNDWKNVSAQAYTAGNAEEKAVAVAASGPASPDRMAQPPTTVMADNSINMIRTGDVLFAVIDTSANSDEPGPILATIIAGRLKGTKLIGSFNLPSNAKKMVITFNAMSIPGAPKTMSISAYAIDPNTARTALSSKTNNHYLLRYGSLFASSFIEGFGNAFQSANTTVTIGGTGTGNNVTIANGVGRSTLENAVIGLATVGKQWGQQAQVLFNTPPTVEVYSGTPIGVLFTQDVKSI